MNRRRANLSVLAFLGVLLAIMTGLVAESATIYRLFCAATGYNGTTQRVAANDAAVSSRVVTVRFTTNVAPDLPWRFRPVQRSVKVRLGEDTLVFFEAENLSDRPIVGHATFNVTPEKVGLYFKKIQCFCFTEERLAPHQKVEMPVDFYVDPQLGTDPSTTEVHNITLSYTFYESLQPAGAADLSRFDRAAPDPEAGRKLFASTCATCHTPDHNKVGPKLAGVVGRKAGSVPGYPYSPALEHAGVVWTPDTLDQWLAGPGKFIAGAAMPFSLPDKLRRRDIIAYLETLKVTQDHAAAGPGKHPG